MPKGHALAEDVKDRIWELRAQGLSEAEVGRRLGYPRVTVSRYVARFGGIRPRARRRAARCLTLAEREEVSRGIARGHPARRRPPSGPSGLAEDPPAAPTKLELCPELRRLVVERLKEDHSPQRIAGWLRFSYPDNEQMQVSHETIYRALYVQTRGSLKRELTQHLRTRRQRRFARSQSSKRQGQGKIAEMVMISERPPEVEDRAVPGHWEGDLLIGTRNNAVATLVRSRPRAAASASARSRRPSALTSSAFVEGGIERMFAYWINAQGAPADGYDAALRRLSPDWCEHLARA